MKYNTTSEILKKKDEEIKELKNEINSCQDIERIEKMKKELAAKENDKEGCKKNKRLTIFYVLEILKEKTDDNHRITIESILKELENNYECTPNRKTVSESLNILKDLGYGVEREGKKGAYTYNIRNLEFEEIRFLIDSIYSSANLDSDYVKQLSEKLTDNLSENQKRELTYSTNISKSTCKLVRNSNKEFFANIQAISEAISKGKKITFDYYTLNIDKELVKNNKKYKFSPYNLINNCGKYYALGYCEGYEQLSTSTFRLDYMKNVNVLDGVYTSENEDIVPVSNMTNYDGDIERYINEHIYPFNNKVITVKVLVKNEYNIKYLYEWCPSAKAKKENDGKVYATITNEYYSIKYWLLQYMEQFKLIITNDDSKKLKEEIVKTLQDTINDYNI